MLLSLVVLAEKDADGVSAAQCGTEPGVCVACAEQTAGKRPYWTGTECLSCSEGRHDGNPYFNPVLMLCVTWCPWNSLETDDYICRFCPEEAPYYDKEFEMCRTCDEAFHGQKPYWDPMTWDCVPTCPDTRPTRKNTNVCKTCSEIDPERPYWNRLIQGCSDYYLTR